MPFKSLAQKTWMKKNQPGLAQKWEEKEKTKAYKAKKKQGLVGRKDY